MDYRLMSCIVMPFRQQNNRVRVESLVFERIHALNNYLIRLVNVLRYQRHEKSKQPDK